jgi:hypothetical protein
VDFAEFSGTLRRRASRVTSAAAISPIARQLFFVDRIFSMRSSLWTDPGSGCAGSEIRDIRTQFERREKFACF